MMRLTGTVMMMLSVAAMLAAAPYEGRSLTFRQPDGSGVPVSVAGDEWYQDVRTPSGSLLCRDDSGWICFAKVNAVGDALVSTGVRYQPGIAGPAAALGLTYAITLSASAKAEIARKHRMERLGSMTYERPDRSMPSPAPGRSPAAAGAIVPDTIWGLTVLADFADQPAVIDKSDLEDLLNKSGYTGYNNKGSVKDYYYEVSGGHLVYVNRVTDYIRASQNKSYYDRVGGNPQAFMQDVLGKLKASGFDFSFLTRNSSGRALSVNVLYAGEPEAGWSEGLWPHQGTLQSTFNCGGGVYLSRYEMTDISNSPAIGTLCHENGHMLFGWQDLYAYDNATNGAGRYCVMSTASSTNPMYPNPYYRVMEGWINTVDIGPASTGSVYTIRTDDDFTYRWSRGITGGEEEAFYIDVKAKSGRNSSLPDAGLCIWHVDSKGSNTNGGGIGRDYVNVEQADGSNDLELSRNTGDADDLFDAASNAAFSDNTSPNGRWHDGTSSGIDIRNVSAVDVEMSFSVGAAVMTPTIKVLSPNGGDTVQIGDSLEIRWQDNISGQVKIELVNTGTASAVAVSSSTDSDGKFSWLVPQGTAAGSGYTIRISESGNNGLTDESDAVFSIVAKLPRLTVVKGTGSGRYEGGTVVPIVADSAPMGQEFAGWTGTVASIADVKSASTTITIPAEGDLSITATYRDMPPDGILMPPGRGNTVQIVGDTLFYDDGGTFKDYAKTFDGDITLLPDESGRHIVLEFLSFAIEDVSDGRAWDTLLIYDGTDSTADLIGAYWGDNSPGILTASSASGALTVRFKSDEGVEGLGWKAKISLTPGSAVVPVALPASYGFLCVNNIVQFSVPATGAGNAAVFSLVNSLGRRVGTWEVSRLTAGWHRLDLTSSGAQSFGAGMYILTMRSSGWSASRRVVIGR